jgi:DeoR family fructose operon transcriptional repressor
VSVRHGLSTPDSEEAATKRALVESAQHVVVLADATKVGQERAVRFASLDEIDVLVTDDSISRSDVSAFEAAGVDVVEA